MERNNGKIIAIIALVVAVIGLSLGFAAFSTSLQISTSANVNVGGSNWNVGFSVDGTNIADIANASTKAANNSNPGVLNVTKYTISQGTNATLSTTNGSNVSYNLNILNKGSVDAYLDSVDFSNVTVSCANVTGNASTLIEGTSAAGTTKTGGNGSTITNEDCAKMFGVTLNIHSTDYTSTVTDITGKSIAAGGSTPVVLTVAFLGNAAGTSEVDTIAASLDGDIIVSIGTIGVEYKSVANSGS